MYIRDLVTQSLESGYLSLAAENHLRQLLSCKYDADDLQAFMKLQQAIMTGTVKQESRETARLAVEATSRKSLKRD